MFPSKNKNRKRRRSKSTNGNFWDEQPEKAKSAQSSSDPREKAHQLHAKIGALESFLQTHHEAEMSRLKMKSENILPPPEHYAYRETRPVTLSLAQMRRYHSNRSKNGVQFLGLFCLACAIGWWILFAPV